VFAHTPGHQYVLVNYLIVLLFLKCPAVSLLWLSVNTSFLNIFSTYTIPFYKINLFDSLVLSISNILVASLFCDVLLILVIKRFSVVTKQVAFIAILLSFKILSCFLQKSITSSLFLFLIKSGLLLSVSVIILSVSLQYSIQKLY
jgi:hypothetical protein